MDFFKDTWGEEWDLDDLSTYPDEWKSKKSYDLWLIAWTEAGRSLFYMQFIHPDWDYDGKGNKICNQEERVAEFCKELVDMRVGVIEDSPENCLKVIKWLYRFQDETENQC